MYGQVLELSVDHEAERKAEQAHAKPAHEQRPPVHTLEVNRSEVRQHEIGFAAHRARSLRLDCRGFGELWRRERDAATHGQRQQEHRCQNSGARGA